MECLTPSNAQPRQVRAGESRFPPELARISDPPLTLYVRGRSLPERRVAVVGARATDSYGARVARQLGHDLARAGVCVISGGAGGIDTAALEGCLEAGGFPVAVLGTGLDIVYPAENRQLFERIALAGALLSEYPPGTPGLRHHFVRRNRIISALCSAVVVVRAAEKSGSLITARYALRQGKVLVAVPGRVGEPLSAGVHQLLKQGAILAESAADVLRALCLKPPVQQKLNLGPTVETMDGDERRLWDALGADSHSIDELILRTGLSVPEISATLLELELKGWVVQKPGMVYLRK